MNRMLMMIAISTMIAISIYSSAFLNAAFAMKIRGEIKCEPNKDGGVTCCQRETERGQIIAERYCTTCKNANPLSDCSQRELQM